MDEMKDIAPTEDNLDAALEEALAEASAEEGQEEPEKEETVADEEGEQEEKETEGEEREEEAPASDEGIEGTDEAGEEGRDEIPVEPEEIEEVLPKQPTGVLPDQVLLTIQSEAEKTALKALGLEEIPDPDLDRASYDRYRRLADNYSRRMEQYVAQQTTAKMEADRFFMDLGREKREKFIQFFDSTLEKMSASPKTRPLAETIMGAIQTQDYATLFPVIKKFYQKFATNTQKTKKKTPPKTERSVAHIPAKEKDIADLDELTLAKKFGYEYPELE